MKSVLPTVLALALLAGCSRAPQAERLRAPSLPLARARIAVIRSERMAMTTDVAGTIRPTERAQLAAKVMGVIDEMPLTLGQSVKRGDVLVKISAGEISARVVQAQAQLNAAQRDLQRERDLLAKGASTADMVRGLEDRFTAAQAMVREAEVMLGYATLRAPFDGVISRKLANVGDLASPGSPLAEIESNTGFEVDAGIPDSLSRSLSVGTSLSVEIPAAGTTVTGKLVEFSSAADANAHTVTAKISLPAHGSIRSGQFARVLIPGEPVPALLVPSTAVTSIGQLERVFIADRENHAVLRLVKTGARQGDRVEVLSGLDDGERVVVAAPTGLQEGQSLEIAP